MTKPICKQCESQGKSYGVTLVGSYTTLQSTHIWWDEDGTKHTIGPTTFTTYRCTNGHHFQEEPTPPAKEA